MLPRLLPFVQLTLLHLAAAQEQFHSFKTHPEFLAPFFNITHSIKSSSKLAPGFNFIAAYGGDPPHPRGPQIFDREGNLVWSGAHMVERSGQGKRKTQNFKTCDYRGRADHLCWTEGASGGPEGVNGRHRVFNNQFKQEGEDLVVASSWSNPSPAEFNVMSGGESFLQVAPKSIQADLTPYKGGPRGWVIDACFQDVSMNSGGETFRWCSLDHFKLWETKVFLDILENQENETSTTAGKGTKLSPWNFADLNSVDKDTNGDYLLSFRHLDQIVKVAGRRNTEPGKVIYRIGGTNANYPLPDDALFRRQHHARFVSTSEKEDVITIFDNHSKGADDEDAKTSSCKMISIDKVTKRAFLKQSFPHPDGKISTAEGSCETLPNSNVLVGWGSVPEFTEFGADGNVLSHASYSKTPMSSYRVARAEFNAAPPRPPKLIAYCFSCSFTDERGRNPLMAWVSWNGATQVHSYKFSLSHQSLDGPWYDGGTFRASGFETALELSTRKIEWASNFAPYVKVEALDSQRRLIPNGMAKTTVFVPKQKERKNCNKEGCTPPGYAYSGQQSRAKKCQISLSHSSPLIFAYMMFFAFISTSGVVLGILVFLRFIFGRLIPIRRILPAKWRGRL